MVVNTIVFTDLTKGSIVKTNASVVSFGSLKKTVKMDKKLFTAAERGLVLDWADKWFELAILIIDVTGTDEPSIKW